MGKVLEGMLARGFSGRLIAGFVAEHWGWHWAFVILGLTSLLIAGYLAINWEATPDEVAQFLQPHPSLSEAFGETVLALTGRGLHVG